VRAPQARVAVVVAVAVPEEPVFVPELGRGLARQQLAEVLGQLSARHLPLQARSLDGPSTSRRSRATSEGFP